MSYSNSPLGEKMAAGAGWLILLKFSERGIGFLSTLVLVRLLLPADFGLVAMAMSLVALVEVLGSFGLEVVLIQNQSTDRAYYDTVWTVYVLYGAVASILLCILAGPASLFYGEPRLEAIIFALALVAFAQGFENIGVVAFQKEMRFDREFWFRLTKKVVGFIAVITLAISFKNYWALVIGSGFSRIFGVALSFIVHPYRPRFSMSRIRSLWRFSFWMWMNNTIVFSATRGYDFIVGKISGPRGLGLFSVAYEIAALPTSELVDPIARAIFPAFSTMAGVKSNLRLAVIQSASIISLLTVPLGAGIAVLSEPLVMLVLGRKWSDAGPVIAILAIYGILRAAHAGTGSAYNALALPRIITIVNLPHLLVGWPLMFLTLPAFGIVGAGYAIISASVLGLIINYNFAKRILGVEMSDILGYYWRPSIACVVMTGVESTILDFFPPIDSAPFLAAQMALYISAGAIAYLLSLSSLWLLAGRPAGAEEIFLTWARARRKLQNVPSE